MTSAGKTLCYLTCSSPLLLSPDHHSSSIVGVCVCRCTVFAAITSKLCASIDCQSQHREQRHWTGRGNWNCEASKDLQSVGEGRGSEGEANWAEAMVGMAPALGACRSSCSVCSWGAPGAASGSSMTSTQRWAAPRRISVKVRAAQEVEECNEEDCAPTKEVGKLSMQWEAEDKTKVTGTYPPVVRQEKKWTGYVEKDTAGQTNIYSVEPTVYVSENVFSSGTAGTSTEGSEENAAVAFGLGLIAIAAAASVLTIVSKNAPTTPEVAVGYSGPPLSYYIAKFTPAVAPQADIAVEESSALAAPEVAASADTDAAPAETDFPAEDTTA